MKHFVGFERIGLFGMSHAGLDEKFRLGLLQYRGKVRHWFFHEIGHAVDEVLHRLGEHTAQRCTAFIGHVGSEAVAEALRATGKPVLNIAGSLDVPEWAGSGLDYEAMGRMAAEYFSDAGFRHFLYVPGFDTESDSLKQQGFTQELLRRGHESVWSMRVGLSKEITCHAPLAKRMHLGSVTEWLHDSPKPLAIFSGTDERARELMDFAHFRGLQIPEQIAFLGCDNTETLCEMMLVPLSSIAVPAQRVGWLAAQQIEAQLQGEALPQPQRLPPERVVVRTSSDLVALDDPVVADAVALMRLHAHERITIAEITEQLPVSRRRFSERFREVIGRSPREELTRIRVRLAKDRLLDTDQTMFHIAMDCGFADSESMAREFKRWEGLTPNAYRKQHRM